MPPALVTNLVRALADDWSSVRRDAAYALGVVMTPPVDARVADERDLLARADPDSSVRLAAVEVARTAARHRAGDQLIGRIVDPDLPVRLAAMRAVGEIREARALVAPQEQPRLLPRGHGRAGRARGPGPHRAPVDQRTCSRRNGSRRARRTAAMHMKASPGSRVLDADAVAMEQLLTEERDEAVVAAMALALLAAAGRPYAGSPRSGTRRSRHGQSGAGVRRRAGQRAAVSARA